MVLQTKKSFVFSSLKIAFSIILFVIGLQANAKHGPQKEVQVISDLEDLSLQHTNDYPCALVEYKSAVSPELVFNVKKTGKIPFFKQNTTQFLVGKTKYLSHNFSYCVIPSFGISEIIFPFHSFL